MNSMQSARRTLPPSIPMVGHYIKLALPPTFATFLLATLMNIDVENSFNKKTLMLKIQKNVGKLLYSLKDLDHLLLFSYL